MRVRVLLVALLFVSSAVHAQSYLYSFGTQIHHPSATVFQPANTFATMAVTTYDSIHYTFDLRTQPTLGSSFENPSARIGGIVFNTSSSSPVVSGVALAPGTWGVSNIMHLPYSFQLGGIAFDFTEAIFGNGGLTSGERVVWNATFGAPTEFAAPPFALKVFGIGSSTTDYAFYSPTTVAPIPEPETYAMMLAGLGLMGFVAGRRRAAARSIG